MGAGDSRYDMEDVPGGFDRIAQYRRRRDEAIKRGCDELGAVGGEDPYEVLSENEVSLEV